MSQMKSNVNQSLLKNYPTGMIQTLWNVWLMHFLVELSFGSTTWYINYLSTFFKNSSKKN